MVKIRYIWDKIPILIFVTDLLPKRFGGGSLGIIVLIRPKYKDNEGLIQHELTHIKQNLRTCLWSGFKQNWDKGHRLERECEAYAVQLSYSSSKEFHRKLYLSFLENKYNLNMPKLIVAATFNSWIRKISDKPVYPTFE